MQVASVKPNTVYHGRGKDWLQHTIKKTIYYTVGLAVGYFRLPCGHSRRARHCRSRAGARHGMCELTHGMAGERHGRSMLCVNRPYVNKKNDELTQPHHVCELPDVTRTKATFCPHPVFTCSIRLLQETSTTSLYKINLLTFLVEAHSVLCELRTEIYV